MKRAVIIAAALVACGCTSMNADWVKRRAPAFWQANGFQVVAYEGYNFNLGGPFGYGGACVWYQLRQVPDNGVLYTGCLMRWGDELHMYSMRAIDAFRPPR